MVSRLETDSRTSVSLSEVPTVKDFNRLELLLISALVWLMVIVSCLSSSFSNDASAITDLGMTAATEV